jgi:hypothetical protein
VIEMQSNADKKQFIHCHSEFFDEKFRRFGA